MTSIRQSTDCCMLPYMQKSYTFKMTNADNCTAQVQKYIHQVSITNLQILL